MLTVLLQLGEDRNDAIGLRRRVQRLRQELNRVNTHGTSLLSVAVGVSLLSPPGLRLVFPHEPRPEGIH